jgi:integrase/recombinase XerD
MPNDPATLPVARQIATLTATRAQTDDQLLRSWLDSLSSPHTRRNFETTARRFLAELPTGLRRATVEDVRAALASITRGVGNGTARQYALRAKSLLGYAHRFGYTLFNVGAAIKPPKEVRALAKRIVGELDVRDLIRSARSERNRVLLAVMCATGLRVSEIVALNIADVIQRQDGRVQMHIVGKGGKERDVLVPQSLGAALLQACGGRAGTEPVFCSSRGGRRLTERAVNHLVKDLANRAGVNPKLSPHWLRHAHASHSLDRGAPLSLVAGTLGHANVSTTSAYLHAKPGASSGDNLDPKVWG